MRCYKSPGLMTPLVILGLPLDQEAEILAEAMIEPFGFPSSALSIPGSEPPAHQSPWEEAPCYGTKLVAIGIWCQYSGICKDADIATADGTSERLRK
jgi:hypothetical protein